jgi:two-component system chemotaxis response regulator CheB
MQARHIIVIGGSRGALGVLRKLAEPLPVGLDAALFVVLHIGRHESSLPALLSKWGPMPARHAVDGEQIQRGTIYVAPPDQHMRLEPDGHLRIFDGPVENYARPAIDPLFRSAALSYGSQVVGVILTGDLDDGAAGLATVRAHGGYCIVQDPGKAEAASMPLAAIISAGADVLAAPSALAQAIVRAVNGAALSSPEQRVAASDVLDLETRLAEQRPASREELDRLGEHSSLSCPECGANLWRIRNAPPLRYRCHRGHAFSALSLERHNSRNSANAIWAAIRAVNERIIFARERQRWAMSTGDSAQIRVEQGRIEENEKLAAMLRGAVSSAVQT